MPEHVPSSKLPPIPPKRYFTVGEVSELCGVKPHVLRQWEQVFSQLKPAKRRGSRRYYQHHEVMLIRRIRELLYDQGLSISSAHNQLLKEASEDGNRAASPQVKGQIDLAGLKAELKAILDLLQG